jgi:hypothetical protein
MKQKKAKIRPRHKIVLKKISENLRKGMTYEQARKEAGYSDSYAHSGHLSETDSWKELMQQYLSDELVAKVHNGLLKSTRVEHMVFPVAIEDWEIKELLEDVNCFVRKIMHGETATHVWFWAANDKARKDGVDMAYKLKKRYEDTITVKHGLAGFTDADLERELAGVVSRVSKGLAALSGKETEGTK